MSIDSSRGTDGAAAVSLAEFARHPIRVGSAFPASNRMVRRMLQPIDWSATDVLVEYGPGTGRFTARALAKMKRGSMLLAIESGQDFVEHLRASLGHDDRLHVVRGSAVDVIKILADRRVEHADCILSGLPFSTLPPDEAQHIIAASAEALRPSGIFAAYQMRKAIEPLLRSNFFEVKKGYEWWNIPPCHLYWASGLRS